jgi:hypothetical protein
MGVVLCVIFKLSDGLVYVQNKIVNGYFAMTVGNLVKPGASSRLSLIPV